jgi:DNA-binding HxlR family transcriptional regulator
MPGHDKPRSKKKSKSSSRRPAPRSPGRFAYDGLDRAIHEKARLGILTSLVTNPQGLVFGELKELCALSDGNLNRHLKVLQEAGLVEVWKGFSQNRPQTLCRITREGSKRFLEYVGVLEQVVSDAAEAAGANASARPPEGFREVWSPA